MDVNKGSSCLECLMCGFDLLGGSNRDRGIILLARDGSGNCYRNDHRLHLNFFLLPFYFDPLLAAKQEYQPWTTVLEASGSKAGWRAEPTEAMASAATIAAPPIAMNIAVGPV